MEELKLDYCFYFKDINLTLLKRYVLVRRILTTMVDLPAFKKIVLYVLIIIYIIY